MLARVSSHFRHNLVAYLALFVALGGTGAYAADTIGSEDVIDESLLSQDVKDGEVKNSDLGNNSVTTAKINDGSVSGGDLGTNAVTSAKINDGSVSGGDLGTNAVTSAKINDGSVSSSDLGTSAVTSAKVRNEELLGEDVKNDTLTGDDIDEDSLNVPLANALKNVSAEAGAKNTQTAAMHDSTGPGTTLTFDVPGFGDLSLRCNTGSLNFSYENQEPNFFEAWMDVGGGDAVYQHLSIGDQTIASGNNTGATNTSGTGEAITLRVSGGFKVLTIWAFGTRRSSTGFCDFSVQAVWAQQG